MMAVAVVARVYLVALACLAGISDAKSADDRFAWMKNTAASSSGHLIRFNKNTFYDHVLATPRSYNTVVIFNAISPRFQCPACKGIGTDTKLIATSIYNAQSDDETPVFVAEVEFDHKDCGLLFGDLGITTAPIVAFVKSSRKKVAVPAGNFLEKIKSADKFDFNTKGFRAEAVVEWINDRSGLKAAVDRPIDYGAIFRETIMPLFVMLLPFLLALPFLYRHRHDFRIYFILALCCYLFSVSGGMFNILKSTPWDHRNDDGSVSYIHNGNGWQLGSESYICGGIQVVMGCVLLALNTFVAEMKFSKSRNLLAALAIGSFVAMFSILRGLVTRKMGSYHHGWVYQW